jgi:hypothetical protein
VNETQLSAIRTLSDVTMQCIDIAQLHHYAIGVLFAAIFLVGWVAVVASLRVRKLRRQIEGT